MTPAGTRRWPWRKRRLRRALLLAFAGLVVMLATMLPAAAALSDPCGVGGNEITCENSKPGNPASEWQVTGQGDSTIQGFAQGFSFDQGQTVNFKITTTASSYSIDIYRLGYYGGLGARKVATIPSTAVVATSQPACVTDATGLADCGNWSVSASWAIPSDAASGVYIARPKRTNNGGASHIVFIVRDDDGTSNLLAQVSDTTWQAYNRAQSGNSLYFGTHTAVGLPAGRAYKVSYNRPFTNRAYEAKNWLFALEYPMIRFLERNGYDVSYFSGLDASARGAEIPEHRAYMVLGHDEYWSQNQRTNVTAARDAGTHLAFFTGNDGFWKTRWESSIDGTGTPFRTMVSYKETAITGRLDPTGIWTGLWRSSPASIGDRPENELSGTLFQAQTTNDMFVPAADGKMRLWRNTSVAGLATGTQATFPSTLGYEWNEAVDNAFRPGGLVYMSTSTHDLGLRYDSDGPGSSTHHLTLYKHRSGALVFSAGLINWPWNLDATHDEDPGPALPDSRIQQATVNLLADMGAQAADLQVGLVPATASTDTVAPTATVSSPPPVQSFLAGDPVTITGTAADDGGGIVGGVEVSLDGGHTFHPATGRSSWTYSTLAPANGPLDLKVRAIDDSGNIGSPVSNSCPCTIWRNTATPATPSVGDANPYTLGVKFRVDQPGFITSVRFYKGPGNVGTHVGHLWTAGGTKLTQATFTGESASGWQEVDFPAPVSVTANTTYVASYYAPSGGFSVTQPYFSPTGVENPPLHALADGVSGANGVYLFGGNGFPVQTFGSSNYWVDVVFETIASDNTPPTVTSTSPAANATNVPRTANVSAHFSEQLDPNTVGATTFELRDASNAVVPAAVSYDAASGIVSLDPTSRLAAQTTYTMTVRGGAGGVKDPAGNPLAANYVWSFTTPAQNTCPCSFFAAASTPTELDVPVNDPYELGIRFTPDLSGYITAIRFYKGPSNTGLHKGHVWDAAGNQLGEVTFTGESAQGWQVAQFAAPIAVTANQTYTASYFVPNGHFSRTMDYFDPLGVDAPPLFAFSSPEVGGNGVFAFGGSAFPNQSFASSNYWVDVVFTTAAVDSSPPTVESTNPASGATGIAVGTNITATFSEPLDATTVNATTFELRRPDGTLVPATVQYVGGSVFVTTDPASPLQLATTYTATLRGGPGGIKDPAGNALATDYVWSFSTSQPVSCPCSIWTTPPTPANPSVALRGVYELGVKFRSDIAGYVTGVRFYKGTANTGTHRGRVWTSAGTMLGDAVFTNETATGWQTVTFATPVSIDVDTTYIASYYAPVGGFAQDHPFFGSGINNPPLHALADGVDGPNGTYKFEPSPDEYPFLGFDASNYYVDVIFEQTATDTTPPVTSLLTKPPAATTSADADFTFKPEPQALAECSLDGGSFTTCTSPLSYSGLAEGLHTFSVRATDTFGNVETTPLTYTWHVDGTPPAAPGLSFGGFANASATGSTVFFRSGASGGFTVTGTSSDGPLGSGVARLTFPSLGGSWTGGGADTTSPYEGTYTFGAGSSQPAGAANVTADDNAGTSSAPTPFTVLADATAPATTAACDGGPCSGAWQVGPVAVTLTATDGGSGVGVVRYTTDGSAPTAASPAYTGAIAVTATTTIRYFATDKVGNAEVPLTLVLQVDSTAPSAPSLSYSAFSNASATGNTIFYRPGVAGGFTVTPLAVDPESGVTSYDYPVLTSGWSHVAGAYSFTAAAGDPDDPNDLTATNGSNLISAPTSFTVTPDAAAPVTSASCNGAACSSGWYTTSPVTVDLPSMDAGGSGVGVIRYTTDGSDPTPASPAFAGPLAVAATTTIKFAATDKVGNAETVRTLQVRVDTSAPTTPAVTPVAGANTFVSGTVVYFRGGAAGAFTLGTSAQDPESGIASYLFPPLGSGWTVDVGGLYSFTAAAVDPAEPLAVTASNNAGLQATAGFTVTQDSVAPVTTVSCNTASCSAGWYTAAPISVALAATDTGGSGVDVIRYTTNGTDPTATSPVYAAPLSVSVTTTIKFRAFDHVGNAEATRVQTIQVDTTAPSAPSLSYSAFTNASRTGGTVYFRPGVAGGFTLTPLSTDGESGVASYAYPPFATGWSHTGGVYTFTSTAADPVDPNDVTATNGAGLTSAATGFTVTADGTPPTATVTCTGGCPGWHTSAPVTVTLSAVDGGSDVASIRYTTNGSDPTSGTLYTAPLSISVTTTVRYAAADNVGNVTLGQQLVEVDTTAPSAPTLDLTAGAAASVTGGTVYFRGNAAGSFTLVPSSTDAESTVASYAYPPLSSGWSRVGGIYSFTAAATDPPEPNNVTATNGAGLTSSATSFTVTRDDTAPSVPTTCNGAPCSSGWYTTTPVALALAASDGAGSGVASVRYTTDGSDPAGGTLYSTAIALLATTTVRYAATDKVGNVTTGQQLVQIDTTAPTTSGFTYTNLSNASVTGDDVYFRPGAAGTFTVNANPVDAQSGISDTSYPTLGTGWTGAGGAYSFTATAVDPVEPLSVVAQNGAGLGQIFDGGGGSGAGFTVTADGVAPLTTATCTGGCAGWHTTSPVTVTLTATDLLSGTQLIRYTTNGVDPTAASPIYTGALSLTATTTVKFRAYDRVGNEEAVRTQLVQIDTTAPSPPTLAFSGLSAAAVTGSTVFYRAGGPGAFTLTASSVDAESGVTAYSLPTFGSGWTRSGGTYTFASGAADPTEPNNVTATNAAALVSGPTSFTVTADGSAPVTTAACDGAACLSGWYTTSPVAVTLAATDSGSGVDIVRYTTDGTDPTGTSPVYGGAIAVAVTTTLKFRAYDRVGNVEAAQTLLVQIDASPPSPPTLSFSAFTNASESGGTVYFRPGATGGFTVAAASSGDSTLTTTFPSLGSGWTNTAGVYAYDATAGDPLEPNTVTVTNSSGLSSSTSFVVTADTTAPASTVSCNGGACASGWITTSPVSVALATTDNGSGVAALRYTTDGTDPTPASAIYAAPLSLTVTTTIKFRAYDKVGNAETVRTQLVQIDASAPTAPTFTYSALTNSSGAGGTVYFRPGTSGGFTVSASSTDAQSGIAGYLYPALGSGWTGTNGTYAFDATAVDPDPSTVTATNGAELSATGGFDVTADAAAPVLTVTCSGGCAGWHPTSPVSVTLAAPDSGSGLSELRYTTDGSDPIFGTLYVGALSLSATTTVRYVAVDKVGNVATGSQLVQIDITAPAVPTLTLSESSPTEFISGSTLFYNASGTNTASFGVSATTSDAQSGIADVTFPAIAGMTGGGADTTSPYDATYTWTPTTTAAGSQTVTVHNGANLTSTASFTVTRDATVPTAGSISYTNGYVTTSSVALTTSNGGDGTGSGVNTAGVYIERDSATLTNGTCGTFANTWTTVLSPDTTGVSGTCYRYRLQVPDNVGNLATFTSTSVVKLETTAPTTPVLTITESDVDTFVSGTTLYFNTNGNGGSFTVAAATSDLESGITNVNFAKPSNMNGNGDDTTAPYAATYTWATNSNSATAAVTATNGASLTSAASFTVTRDNIAPDAFAIADPLASARIRSGQVIGAAPTDAASGIASVEFKYCAGATCTYGTGTTIGAVDTIAPYSVTWSSMPADGQYTLIARAIDKVGNLVDSSLTTVTIDNTAPTTDLQVAEGTSPTRQYFRAGVFYYSTAAAGDFKMVENVVDAPAGVQKVDFPAITGTTGFTGSASTDTTSPYESTNYAFATTNTTAPAAKTVTVTDLAGNKQVDTISFVRDITAPAAFAVTAVPKMNNGDTITANASDAGSGISQVEFRYCAGGTCTFAGGTLIATSSSSPYGAAWNAQPADGTYTLIARATDNVGNVLDSSTTTVTVDNTLPALTLAVTEGARADLQHFAGGTLYYNPIATGDLTLAATATDASGITAVDFPALAATGFTGAASSDTTLPYQSTAYTFSPANLTAPAAVPVVVTDGTGNQRTQLLSFVRDTAGPVNGSVSYADGYSSTESVVVTTTDGDDDAGIDATTRVLERRTAPLADGLCGTYVITWATVTGLDTVPTATCAVYRYSIADRVGNSTVYTSTNVVRVDTTAPTAPAVAYSAFTNTSERDGVLYFRSGSTGGFTITATSTDAESGIASVGYPSLGSGWSRTGGAYTFDATAAAPTGTPAVTVTNGAGLASAGTALNVAADASAPVTTAACSGGACAGGWFTSTPVSATLSATDTGSGVDAIHYTTDGSDPTAASPVYTGALELSVATTLKYRAYDEVGNAEAIQTREIRIDATPPSTPALTFSAFTNASQAGGTVYFRPGTTGGFTVTSSSTDAQSAIASTSFPSLGSGWTHSGGVYTFDATAGDPSEPNDVTATNGAGLGSPATSFTVAADSTAPTTTVTCDGQPCSNAWRTSSVSVGLVASDTGSGLAEIRYTTDGSDPTPLSGTVYAGPFDVGASTTVKFRAYDKVGNEESVGSQLVRIDTTAPSAPVLTFSAFANASATAGTVYFRPGTSGAFSVDASSTDAQSGVASTTFPSLGTGWTNTAGVYTFDATAAGSTGNAVTATNGAGLGSTTSFGVTADSTAPGTTVSCSDGCAGWHTTSPVSVTLSAVDAGSGLAEIRYTTDGTAPAGGAVYAGAIPVSATSTVRWAAYDKVGNVFVGSQLVQIDTSAPTAPALDLTAGANASADGTTVYFRPGASGTFTVAPTSTDAQSGVASYGYPSLGTGWTGTNGAYSYDSTATDPPEPNNVTATNFAGLTSDPTSFAVTADSSAPAVTTGCTGGCAGWHTSAPVSVTLAATDSGSGLAQIRYTTDGSDPAAGTVYTAPLSVGATTTVRYAATDKVGNVTTGSQLVQVDTTAPSTPALSYSGFANASATGDTVYFRPGAAGTFTVASSSTDAESAIAATAFPSLGSGWIGTNGAYSFTAGAADPAEPLAVSATNGAGFSSAKSFAVTADSTAPVSTLSCAGAACGNGWYTTQPVDLTLSAADAGSGLETIRYTTNGTDPSPINGTTYVGAFQVMATTVVKFRAYDKVGNEELVGTQTIQIDTTKPSAPALTLAAAGNAVVAGSTVYFRAGATGGFTVGAASTDDQSGVASYSFPPLGSGWTKTGGAYSFDATAVDPAEPNNVTAANGAGLVSDPTSFTVTKDAAAPVSTIACNGNTCSTGWYTTAPVSVALSATDAASGVQQIRYTLDGSDPTPLTGFAYLTPLEISSTTTVKFRAYDNVGNVELVGTQTIRIDGSAPASASLVLSESSDDAYLTGSTVYYNPNTGHSGTFAVEATSDDAESGIARAVFPTLAGISGGGADTTAPYEANYGFGAGSTADGEQTVTVENEAGLTTTATFTVRRDVTAPAGGSIAYAAGYNTTGSVAIATTTGTDDGSGIASSVLERHTAPLTNAACGTWVPWTSVTSPGPDTVASGTCVAYRLRVTDRVGNETIYAGGILGVDTSAPTAPALTLSEASDATFVEGSTLFYNPNVSGTGSFTVTATTADPQSGIDHVTFPAVGGTTGNGDDTGAPYSATYDWTSKITGTGAQSVTAVDGAGLTAGTAFTLTPDAAAPAGHSIALDATGPYVTTTSVAFTKTDGNDLLSGVDPLSGTVQRASATLSQGTCGTFGDYAGSYTTPDTSVVSGNCYRYRYSVADRVGNRSAWVETAVIKVDTTAPPAPVLAYGSFTNAFATGSTVYFRGGAAGGFTVTATVDDPESGVATTTFPTLGSGWTTSGPGAYSFTASAADPADPNDVTATNNAGLTSTAAPFTVTADTTAPTGGSVAYTNGYVTETGLPLAVALADGTDIGSGVDTAHERLESVSSALADGTCAPVTDPFATLAADPSLAYTDGTAVSGRCYVYRYVVSDRVGNETVYTTPSVAKVDTELPTATQQDPGQYLRGTVTLNADAADLGGSGIASVRFERLPAAGTWQTVDTDTTAPYTASLNTTPLADGLNDFRVVATDRAGHQTISAAVTGRRIDNTAPTATITDPGAFLKENVSLAASSADTGGSGVAQVSFHRLLNGSGAPISTPVPWVTTAADDGVWTFRVTVTDNAGNTTTDAVSGRRVDNTAPVAQMAPLPAKVRESVSLSAQTATDSGSGVQSVTFERQLGSGSPTTTSALWDTTVGTPDGSYNVRVIVTDKAGNSTTSAAVVTEVDNSAPVVIALDPANGAPNVLPASSVNATFSRAMAGATITAPDAFTLTGPSGPVGGTVLYDDDSHTATFQPTVPLEESKTYTASIAGTVTANDGEPIFAAQTWTFATGITPPAVTAKTPADAATNVLVGTPVTATFSRDMTASTINGTTFTLTGPSGAVAATIAYNGSSKVATLTPSAPLGYDKTYTVLITTGVKSTEGVALTANVSWTFRTALEVPAVTATTPAGGATNVSTGIPPTATFSTAMDPTTITTSSFTLIGPSGTVGATVAYNSSTKVATLTPSAALANSTSYTATISTAAKASGTGVALASAYSWTFTTIAPTPGVSSTTPAAGAPGIQKKVKPTATFTIAMDSSTLTPSTLTLTDSTGTPVPSTVTYDPATKTTTIAPTADLAGDTTYTVTVDDAVQSTAGMPLAAPYSWSFTTASDAPTVLDRTPAPDGATNVLRTTTVTATFSKQMNAATLSNMTLSGPGGAVAATVALDATMTIATLTPSAALDSNTTYTATLGASLAGTDGTTLGTPISWTFTTVPPPSATSWTPATGATGVDFAVRPTATFSEAMLASSITSTTFTLKKPDGSTLLTNVVYSAATKTATLTPLYPLDYSKTYTAQLSTAVKALDGAPLAAPVTWTFTSSSAGYAKRYESGGATTYTMGGVTFDLDGTGKGGLTRTSTNPIGLTTDDLLYQTERYGLWSYATNVPNGTYIVRTHHAETLKTAAGQRVFNIDITETTGIDATNVDLFALKGANNAYTRDFTVTTTTGRIQVRGIAVTGDPQLSALEIIPAPPTVTANTPANNATGVAKTTTVTATFSRAMDAATINASTVLLKAPGGAVVPAAVSYNAATRVVTLTPGLPTPVQLLAFTQYTVEITTGAQGSEGMALAAPFTWTFRTV